MQRILYNEIALYLWLCIAHCVFYWIYIHTVKHLERWEKDASTFMVANHLALKVLCELTKDWSKKNGLYSAHVCGLIILIRRGWKCP